MRLIYRPEEGDEQEYTFDPDEVTAPEAELLESLGGSTWESFQGWAQAYRENRIRARRAAIWLVRRRDGERTAFDLFAPLARQVDFAFDVPELVILRDTWSLVDTDDARLQVAVVEGMLARLGWEPPAAPAPTEEPGEVGEVDPKRPASRRSRASRKTTSGSAPATASDASTTDGPSPST